MDFKSLLQAFFMLEFIGLAAVFYGINSVFLRIYNDPQNDYTKLEQMQHRYSLPILASTKIANTITLEIFEVVFLFKCLNRKPGIGLLQPELSNRLH